MSRVEPVCESRESLEDTYLRLTAVRVISHVLVVLIRQRVLGDMR